MDIYEYAMQMEKDGENLYREAAGKADNKGLKSILTMLAEAEVVHYDIFLKMKRNGEIEMTDTPILEKVKNLFIRMREEGETFGNDVSQVHLYKKAQEIEKKSRDFYLEKAGEVKEISQKEIFRRIAEEEKKHYFLLERVIDFVSRPAYWLENPEWYHLEEY